MMMMMMYINLMPGMVSACLLLEGTYLFGFLAFNHPKIVEGSWGLKMLIFTHIQHHIALIDMHSSLHKHYFKQLSQNGLLFYCPLNKYLHKFLETNTFSHDCLFAG